MYFTFLQQVHLADNTSLDNLPMNTFFSGLLDLGESSESGIDSEFGKKLNPTSGMMGGLRMKNMATSVKRPPLRQPFVNGQVVVGVDAEKKMSQDMVNSSLACADGRLNIRLSFTRDSYKGFLLRHNSFSYIIVSQKNVHTR